MKTKIVVITGLIFSLCIIVAESQAQTTQPGLIAHEWGTFTSIAGKDGQAVEWLPLSGRDDLPGFVEHFCFAAFKIGLRGTVRMETPVLYFYSPHDVTLSVHVAFSHGLITEWYPHANQAGPSGRMGDSWLYQKHPDGSISWDSVRLQPGLAPEMLHDAEDSRYYAARNTASVPLHVKAADGDQHEKFLFYRGVAAFPIPISATVITKDSLEIKSPGAEDISDTIFLERRGDRIGYRISHAPPDGSLLEPPQLNSTLDSLYNDLEKILIARGLFRDEAHAMVETWHDSWFEEGSRLLYIVPRSFIDQVLPLTIQPAPEKTVRVFVGRLEVVTSATRQAVAAALASNDAATLNKYSRFLQPIAQIIGEQNMPAQQQSNSFTLPCEVKQEMQPQRAQR